MIEILFRLTPKVANEFVFVLGILGMVVLLIKRKPYLCAVIIMASGMLIWRVAYGIVSSRYASCFIYLFSIPAAYFISYLTKFNKNKGLIFVIGTTSALLCLFIQKNYCVTQINSNLEIVAQLHDSLTIRTKDNWTLIAQLKDVFRIRQLEKRNNPFSIYPTEGNMKELETYISNYKTVGQKQLYCITVDSNINGIINLQGNQSNSQHILSLFYQKNKKKRIHVYKIDSQAKLITLSRNKTIEPESGILKNGDLEMLDSPQDSYKKLKNHIGSYDSYFDYDESICTPVNAYFHNDSIFTRTLPYYNCSRVDPISGKSSALLNVKKGVGYLLFYQRFHSGEYHFSFTFKGKKGTRLCLLYDQFKDKRWSTKPLAYYTIPHKGIFKIAVQFTEKDLNSEDYFLVGAWVADGEAYLDNFCLEKK